MFFSFVFFNLPSLDFFFLVVFYSFSLKKQKEHFLDLRIFFFFHQSFYLKEKISAIFSSFHHSFVKKKFLSSMLRFTSRRCNNIATSSKFLKSSSSMILLPSFHKTTCAFSSIMNAAATSATAAESLRFSSSSQTGFDNNPLHKKLHGLINQARIVVFLTGTPDHPRCGFTVRIVELLGQLPIKYEFVNIMEDEEVCEGLKTYAQWPTYPQLYIDGELIGGWDITRQMVMDGSLIKILHEKGLLLEE
jgi:monothiol glutaredoxin